jgi:hypothetical protein
MNRDDIIRLALDVICEPIWFDWKNPTCRDSLLRFIQEQVRSSGADEREACAKVCEECAKVCEAERERLFWGHNVQAVSADKLAAAIRARVDK